MNALHHLTCATGTVLDGEHGVCQRHDCCEVETKTTRNDPLPLLLHQEDYSNDRWKERRFIGS